MTIKKSLSANLVAHFDFRNGTIKDQTANANNGSFEGNARLVNTDKGKAVFFDGSSGKINCGAGATIADAFDGGGSFVAWIRPRSDGLGDYGRIGDKADWNIFVKAEASGKCDLQLSYNFDNTDGQWDTTATEITLNKWNHIIIVYNNSDVANNPTFYINGVALTVGNGLTEVATPIGTRVSESTDTLYIGDETTGSRTFDGEITDVQLYNSALTQQQATQLYSEALKEANLNKTPVNIKVPESAVSTNSNCVLDLNMEQGMKIIDLTKNCTVTVNSSVDFVNGIFGKAVQLYGSNGSVQVTDVAAIQNIFDGGGSVEVWFYPFSDGEGDLGRILDKRGSGAGSGFMSYLSTEASGMTKLSLWQDFDTNDGVWDTTNAIIKLNQWNHIVWTYNSDSSANDPTLYLNGVALTVGSGLTESSITSGTRSTDVGNDLYVGANSGGDMTFDGIIDTTRLYTAVLTQAQVTTLYELGEDKINYYTNGDNWNVSTGNVTDGFLENSGFNINSGTWQIDDSSDGGKQITNIVAGILYIKSPQAYGQWEFDMYRGAIGNTSVVQFIDSDIATRFGATNLGYVIHDSAGTLYLVEMIGTTTSNLFFTAASYLSNNTWYRIKVTRTNSGVFTVYYSIDGGVTYTIVVITGGGGSNPVIDTTITASTYFVLDLDALDAVRNFRFSPIIT